MNESDDGKQGELEGERNVYIEKEKKEWKIVKELYKYTYTCMEWNRYFYENI
jgi:hypothetical protein